MEKIFFSRGKGRVKKMLTVYSDGEQFRLHFLNLDRTNPSKAERAAGEKEKRFAVLDTEYFVPSNQPIQPEEYPTPELVMEFISFLKEEKRRDADCY